MTNLSGHHDLQNPHGAGRRSLWGATAVAVAVCAVSAGISPGAFWPAYLVSVVFWLGVSLGGLGIALLHRLTGGNWGWAIDRELNAATGALPVAILALLPLFAGAHFVFPWVGGDASQTSLSAHQQSYLAPTAVLIRTFFVTAVWCALARWCVVGNLRRVVEGTPRQSLRLAAIGLIALWLTITIASIDGLMSLSPAWSSSMFGALHAMGFALTGLSFAIAARSFNLASQAESTAEIDVTQDLGSLLLAFNLMWAYFAFSEYLIIWSGDIPYEVNWFVDRQQGWTLAMAVALIVLHFVVPLACLVSRQIKRNPRQLAGVAGLLLLMELCHLAWTVLPAAPGANALSVFFLTLSVVAVGAPWLLLFSAVDRRFPHVGIGSQISSSADPSPSITGDVP